MRNFILWLLLLALTVNAQDLIFKTGFEDGEDINFAPEILSSPVSTVVVNTLYAYPVVAIDINGDILSWSTSEQPVGLVVNIFNGTITWTPDSTGTFSVTVDVSDGLGGAASQSFEIEVINPEETGIPPHPGTLAPELDESEVSVIGPSTEFLYTGDDPIQTGVAADTIDLVRAAVLRGRVTERDGSRLSGVTVSLLDHPEYGQTLTRFDGEFDLVVNGGGMFTVNYEKDGYLPVQRDIGTQWQQWAWLPAIVMIPLDPNVTVIDLTDPAPIQLVIGSSQSDADGTRQAVLMIPAGTTAQMLMPNDSLLPIDTLHIRATEYTVGENGPETMPGELPPASGYTYAVELSADEAIAAGAVEVQFSQSMPFYLDNFIGFPVGSIIPTGSYDKQSGNWVASENGLVVEVTGIDSGLAQLDVDGDGIADSGTTLSDLGIGDAEREALAGLYAAGRSLWRVPMDHFTPWDHNWPYSPPPDADFPPPNPDKPKPKNPCNDPGNSIIDCHNQTLLEQTRVVGTPFVLNNWNTIAGSRSFDIPIIPPVGYLPGFVLRIDLEVRVAGRQFSYFYDPQYQTVNGVVEFEWDGLDAYGRKVQGQVPANVVVTNIFRGDYNVPAEDAEQAFARTSSSSGVLSISGDRSASTVGFNTIYSKLLGGLDLRKSHGLGGWTLGIHHFYDPVAKKLYLGGGKRRSATGLVMGSVASDIHGTISDIEITPNGSTLIAELNRIIRVDIDGMITTIAGNGVPGYSGDDGLATEAQFSNIGGIDLAADGSLYIADRGNSRVRRVAPDGIVSTIAGDGRRFTAGEDGVLATETALNPWDVVIALDGSYYISERDIGCRIRRVDPSGIIETLAGDPDNCTESGDGGPATLAGLSQPTEIALDANGLLYIITTEPGQDHIRAVSPSGTINTVVGGPCCGPRDDGEPAKDAYFQNGTITSLALDINNELFFGAAATVRSVNRNGMLGTLAGSGPQGTPGDGEGGPALAAQMGRVYSLAVGPNGQFFTGERPLVGVSDVVRQIGSPLPGYTAADLLISSEDGNRLYVFSEAGRHLSTRHSLTNDVLFSFHYDSEGRLIEIVDGDGNSTAIERNLDGEATAIVAPGGQTTTLLINPEGYLQSITNPAGEQTSITYTSNGLLATFTDPMGMTATMSYDENDLLVKDDDGSGNILTLSREEDRTFYKVTKTTAMGKVSTYQMDYLSSGRTRSTVTNPDGDVLEVSDAGNGTNVTTQSDGTVITQTHGPGPRFGMQAPVLKSMTITTPGAKTNTITQSRTVALSDPLNILSLETQQDTITVNGRVYTDHYDALTRTLTKTSPEGHQVVSEIDTQGRVTSTTRAPGLDPQIFTYDTLGRLEQFSQGSQSRSYGYDTKNQVISSTDAAGNATLYGYDDAGRVTQMTKAGGQVLNYTYDAKGNRTGLEMPSTDSHSMAYARGNMRTAYTPPGSAPYVRVYDADRDLTSRSLPGGRTLLNNFDSNRRWTGLDYPEASIGFGYDDTRDRMSSLSRTPTSIGTAQDITYLYDGPLVTRSTWTGAASGFYQYGWDNNFLFTAFNLKSGFNTLNSIVSWNADGQQIGFGPYTFARGGPRGSLSQVSDANLAFDLQYDSLGRVEARDVVVNAVPVYAYTLTFNNIGKISAKDETVNGDNHVYVYTYDASGRLTNVTRDAAQVEHYTYDGNDNRLSTLTASATYDAQDRLTGYDGVVYSFNADGFLTARGTETYNYSARGELIRAVLPGPEEISYSYDGLGRRVARTDASGTTEYLYGQPWNQMLVTAARESSGDLTVLYHDPAVGYYAMNRDGVTYYIATDQIGSPRVVTDAAGAVIKVIEYDGFGKRLGDSNPAFELPVGYAGGLEDTATGLVRFGFRDYDQDTGRWTARDPILYDGGQANLFAYAGNNPVNQRDPTGLWCVGASAYLGFGGGVEVCCKAGDCSLCAEGGVGKGGGIDAGEGDPKEEGTRPFVEGGGSCGPLSAGFKCEAGGKCGPNCGLDGGLGPFSVNSNGETSASGGGGGDGDGGDSGDGAKGKCSFGGKGGLRGCGGF
jgi:RHS repeat-associated protein